MAAGSTLFKPGPRFLALVIGWRKGAEGERPKPEVLYAEGNIGEATRVYESAGTEFSEVRLYREPRHHSRRVPTGELSVRKQFAAQAAARAAQQSAMLVSLTTTVGQRPAPRAPSLQNVLSSAFPTAPASPLAMTDLLAQAEALKVQLAAALAALAPASAAPPDFVPPAAQTEDSPENADAEDAAAEEPGTDDPAPAADDLPAAFGGSAVDSDSEEEDEGDNTPTENKTYVLKNRPHGRRR